MSHRITQLQSEIMQQKHYSTQIIQHKYNQTHQLINQLIARIEASNPLNKFKQGYSMTINNKTNKTIKTINELTENTTLKTELIDGYCISTVKSITKKKYDY